MAEAEKLTFKSPVVASIAMAVITGCSVYFGLKSEITEIKTQLNVYIASNISDKTIANYRFDKLDKVAEQVEINTLSIKTIADFIEPKRIELTNRRR